MLHTYIHIYIRAFIRMHAHLQQSMHAHLHRLIHAYLVAFLIFYFVFTFLIRIFHPLLSDERISFLGGYLYYYCHFSVSCDFIVAVVVDIALLCWCDVYSCHCCYWLLLLSRLSS